MFFPPCIVKQTDKKQGSAEVANQKQKSLSLVVPRRVNGASVVTLCHHSAVEALCLRRKRVTFTPQTCDDYGVKVMPLRRKEGWRKSRELLFFYNLLFARVLQFCLRIAYLRPSPCLVANTQFLERLL